MQYRIIVTGATGMVGEGVLRVCLGHPQVEAVLSVSRRPCGITHPKLQEYLVPDFRGLGSDDERLKGYDACFFCAGVSSVGMKEEDYYRNTFETTIRFAEAVQAQHPDMIFVYVSGAGTDSTEQGRLMWARVKGKTENTLLKIPFRKVHNFRPGFMKAVPGQIHTLRGYNYLSWLYPVLKVVMPNGTSTLEQVGKAMIHTLTIGSDKPVLEVRDINRLGDAG